MRCLAFLWAAIRVSALSITPLSGHSGRCGRRGKSGVAPCFGRAGIAQLPTPPTTGTAQSEATATLVLVEWRHSDALTSNLPSLAHIFDPVFSSYAHYHHCVEIPEGLFMSDSGLAVRRSKSGHCTSFTTFSAIEPKISGCQPEMPCVEITTMSICS